MLRHTDIACPACGCVCDDLALTVENNRLLTVEPACPLAEPWFREQAEAMAPEAEIDGREVPVEEALQRAAEILSEARYPLIYGLSRSATAGQRAAVALAERIGAVIDTTASLCHGPSIVAVQEVGESTATLGEIRHRADLVIFWGCHPAETHPRHAERYSVYPSAQFVPGDRAGRTIVLIGNRQQIDHWRLDPAGSRADLVVPVEPGRDFEVVNVLRLLIADQPLLESATPGADLTQLRDLAHRMRNCRSGVFFFGTGLTGTGSRDEDHQRGLGHANVSTLLRLVAELHQYTRFYARRMRLYGDVSGADSVLCWQTGYPFGVSLTRGYARYNPGEYTAQDILDRRETDACLLIGSETTGLFNAAANAHLRRIPTITLDYPASSPDFVPTVRFTTAVYGLHAPGTVYRMDEVPLPLRPVLRSVLPTDAEVLARLSDRIGVERP